jgi:hypothetical protein
MIVAALIPPHIAEEPGPISPSDFAPVVVDRRPDVVAARLFKSPGTTPLVRLDRPGGAESQYRSQAGGEKR